MYFLVKPISTVLNHLKPYKTNNFIKNYERQEPLMLEDYPDLLTRKQTQELLHLGKNRILNYIHTGQLRALVLDGRYLILKEDIINFIRTLPYA